MMLQLNGLQRYSFGLFVIVFPLLLFTTSFAGCTEKNILKPIDASSLTDTGSVKTISYLALGDSYTIGQGVQEEDRFPVQASALLSAKGYKINKPHIIAMTGWTTRNLLAAIEKAKPTPGYSVVSLLVGVNDQYQRRDTTGYRQLFTDCLQKAIELAEGNRNHVFVLSIPDYSVTPFGQGSNAREIAIQIDQFNEINLSVSTAFEISYNNVTEISRAAGKNPEMLAEDGLHPSGKQYKNWAALLVPAIQKILP